MALPQKTTAVLLFVIAAVIGVRLLVSGYRVTAYLFLCGVFAALVGWTLFRNRPS